MYSKLPVFSKDGYAIVLRNALANGYSFIRFDQMHSASPGNRYCLMRHDIDTSLKCALEMAEIENSFDIKATYFFMLRSPAYNLFSRNAFSVLNRIKELGHEIALHFDAAHPAILNNDIVSTIKAEADILSYLANDTVHSVSFHQPSARILEGNLFIPGLVNTYNKQQMKDWYYTSDSNRVWKAHNALSVFNVGTYDKIQILIHPIWWIYEHTAIEDAWDNAVLDNIYIMQQQFLDTEGAYGSRREYKIKR